MPFDPFNKIHVFRQALDHVSAYVYIKDLDSRYIYGNCLTLELFGVTGEELTGCEDARFFPPETVKRLKELDARALRGENTAEEFETKDDRGKRRVFWDVKTPIYLDEGEGQIVGLLGISTDVTERKIAEEQRQASEARFRTLIEKAPTAISISRNGVIVYANPKYLELFGYQDANELVGHSIVEHWAPSCRGEVSERLRRHSLGLIVESNYEGMALRRDGSEIAVQVSAVPVDLPDGPAALAFITDISERRRAEEKIQESEARFHSYFELPLIGVAITSPEKGWIAVNARLCDLLGYSWEEFRQMNWAQMTHPEDLPADVLQFNRLLAGEIDTYSLEKRFIRKDGEIIWTSLAVGCVRKPDGTVDYACANMQDITERKRAEDERMRLVTAMEQTAESIVITDICGKILYVNPAFEYVTGYTRQEAIGLNPSIVKSGKHDEAFYGKLWETLTRGEVWRGRFENRRKDGSSFIEDATISPVRDSEGKVVNYMGIKLDVTSQVALEAQFRQAQKLEGIGQLAGGVAHDFNNILAALIMQLDLTGMTENLPDTVVEDLRQIRGFADRASNLTRQLLLFSRKQVMQPADLDINGVVGGLTRMLQRIIGEDVHLQLNLHSQPLVTHADSGMLEQVLMNLVVNARDAMPSGGGLLIETSEKSLTDSEAAEVPGALPKHYVCLRVTDTGSGIAPEHLPHLFEPFFTTKDPGKGTGLGLATAFGIVRQHGGAISVQSEFGKGTTFEILLPSAAAASLARGQVAEPKHPGGTETILVVEDEAPVRRLIRLTLERAGYHVLEAVNGVDALLIWEDHRDQIHLLLTDMVMPGGFGGRELVERMKNDQTGLRVVFMSGYSEDIAGQQITLPQGQGFIQKPFPTHKLLETIRSFLDAKQNE